MSIEYVSLGMTPCRGHSGCVRIMYMGCATDGVVTMVITILSRRDKFNFCEFS